MTACYLINKIPTKVLQDQSPHEVLNKNHPSIDHLRVFGCLCFVLIPGEQRNKLEPKSTRAMFIGYSPQQKGYKCYVPETRRVLVSRDVKFVEAKGYYEEKSWDEVKDLSQSASDRAENLRIVMENIGIRIPRREAEVQPQSTNPYPTGERDQEGPVNEVAEEAPLDPGGGIKLSHNQTTQLLMTKKSNQKD